MCFFLHGMNENQVLDIVKNYGSYYSAQRDVCFIHDILSASNFKDRELLFQVGNLNPQPKFSGLLPPSLSLPPPSDPSLS